MFINNLNNYSYTFYKDTCDLLKNSGFNPNNILDIGANACQTADIMRSVWPKSNILLIEGNSSFESTYKSKNYNYIIKLLGKENKIVEFYKTKWSDYCSGNSIYRELNRVYNDDNVIIEKLPIYKLDDITTDTFDLIKIDTQGSELDIILGGKDTISKTKVIICEVALIDINVGGCKKEEIMRVLTNRFKFDYVETIEGVLGFDNSTINYENLLFIKP